MSDPTLSPVRIEDEVRSLDVWRRRMQRFNDEAAAVALGGLADVAAGGAAVGSWIGSVIGGVIGAVIGGSRAAPNPSAGRALAARLPPFNRKRYEWVLG